MAHRGKGRDQVKEERKTPTVVVPLDDFGYTESFLADQAGEMQQFFDKYGFVVVRDVLTPQACEETLNEIFSLLENGTGFIRSNVDTWSRWPADSIERYGSPHKPPVFLPQFLRNRQNPNVFRVFSTLLHDDKLLVNHDRCCFFRPTKAGTLADGQALSKDMPEWGTNANFHIDMNPWAWMGDGAVNRMALSTLRYDKLNNFIFENNQPSHSDGVQLQGVLNLADNREEDGGFSCVPGFHLEFGQYFNSRKPNMGSPSYNFTPKEEPYHRGTRIVMRVGSMVVWDQRMAHGSLPNRSAHFRSAQFIKLFPQRTVDAARARARAETVYAQIKGVGFEAEVTELGRSLFGLDLLGK